MAQVNPPRHFPLTFLEFAATSSGRSGAWLDGPLPPTAQKKWDAYERECRQQNREPAACAFYALAAGGYPVRQLTSPRDYENITLEQLLELLYSSGRSWRVFNALGKLVEKQRVAGRGKTISLVAAKGHVRAFASPLKEPFRLKPARFPAKSQVYVALDALKRQSDRGGQITRELLEGLEAAGLWFVDAEEANWLAAASPDEGGAATILGWRHKYTDRLWSKKAQTIHSVQGDAVGEGLVLITDPAGEARVWYTGLGRVKRPEQLAIVHPSGGREQEKLSAARSSARSLRAADNRQQAARSSRATTGNRQRATAAACLQS
jgi:hypothetical protein